MIYTENGIRNVAMPVTLLLFHSFISFRCFHTFYQKLKNQIWMIGNNPFFNRIKFMFLNYSQKEQELFAFKHLTFI